MGFEPTISVGVPQQTYTLDRAATGTGVEIVLVDIITDIIITFCKWATLRLDKGVLLRYINHPTYCYLRTNTVLQYSQLQHKIQSYVCLSHIVC